MSLYIQPYLEPTDPEKPTHDPIADEMSAWGLGPGVVSDKAWLAARQQLLEGTIEPFDFVEVALRYDEEN